MVLGGIDGNTVNNMEASWSRSVNVTDAGTATLSFDYRMIMSSEYESDEYGEIQVKLDGNLVTIGANQYVISVAGDGNGGSAYDSGWQTINIDLGNIATGSHTVELVGFNNKKTASDETTEVRFDNVTFDVAESATDDFTIEPISTFDVTVQTTDAGGNTYSEVVTLEVANRNEAPTDLQFDGTPDAGNTGISLNTDGGNNAYLSTTDAGDTLGGLTELTIEIQFSTDRVLASGEYSNLVSYHAGGGTDEFEMALDNNGSGIDIYLEIDGSTAVVSSYDFVGLMDGGDHQLSFTWDNTSGDYEIFVDGVSVANGTGLNAGHTLATGGELVFGQEQDSQGGGFDLGQGFEGTYNDVRIFNDVRTSQEISDNALTRGRQQRTGAGRQLADE